MADVETYKKGGKVKKTRRAGAKPRATATAIVNVHLGRKSSKTTTQQPRGPTQATQLLGVVNALTNRLMQQEQNIFRREVQPVVSEPNKPIVLEQPKPVSVQAEPNQPVRIRAQKELEEAKKYLEEKQQRMKERAKRLAEEKEEKEEKEAPLAQPEIGPRRLIEVNLDPTAPVSIPSSDIMPRDFFLKKQKDTKKKKE
jgi:hypothetical protein